ncbi:MAG: hypothetical protein ACXWLY_17830 [Thermoanaerobaculia bacterium]
MTISDGLEGVLVVAASLHTTSLNITGCIYAVEAGFDSHMVLTTPNTTANAEGLYLESAQTDIRGGVVTGNTANDVAASLGTHSGKGMRRDRLSCGPSAGQPCPCPYSAWASGEAQLNEVTLSQLVHGGGNLREMTPDARPACRPQSENRQTQTRQVLLMAEVPVRGDQDIERLLCSPE